MEHLTVADLSRIYPRLYHMAEAGSWESVRARGLLSTTALLDLFEISGPGRRALEQERRPKKVTLTHPQHGIAVIRDQKPMTDGALLKCLQDGMTPTQWYAHLNRRVFFWVSRERLFKLLKARAYRDEAHVVITVDTASLLERHASRVTLAPINTGATIMKPQPRGRTTFSAIETYPYGYWNRKRSKKEPVVELAVDYSVPDLADHTLRVEEVEKGVVTGVLWERA